MASAYIKSKGVGFENVYQVTKGFGPCINQKLNSLTESVEQEILVYVSTNRIAQLEMLLIGLLMLHINDRLRC